MDIETLRKTCISLPAVTEDIKWDNDLVFLVGGKMFCVAALDPPFSYSFKLPGDVFEEFCNRDGFIPAPYLARAKWIKLTRPGILSLADHEKYIRQSYDLVKARLTQKQRESLGI